MFAWAFAFGASGPLLGLGRFETRLPLLASILLTGITDDVVVEFERERIDLRVLGVDTELLRLLSVCLLVEHNELLDD